MYRMSRANCGGSHSESDLSRSDESGSAKVPRRGLVLEEDEYQTLMIGVEYAVLTVTINRPDVMNSFNEKMCMEFQHLWTQCRDEASIHSIVLRAAGDRAFSTGVDRKEGIEHSANPWHFSDPGPKLGPKSNGCFKPIICAV